MKHIVKIQPKKPRNPTVPAMRNRKAGAHFRTERKRIREEKRNGWA